MAGSAGPRILVVEDDDGIRGLLVVAVGREGVVVDAARDGLVGLELLRAKRYAVVVVDLMMPRVNGFELLTALAAEVPRPRPVILVMTACDEPALRQLDPEVVHGIVRKPFDVQSLAGTIRASALLYPTLPPARAAAAVKAMARIMLCICSGCKP